MQDFLRKICFGVEPHWQEIVTKDASFAGWGAVQCALGWHYNTSTIWNWGQSNRSNSKFFLLVLRHHHWKPLPQADLIKWTNRFGTTNQVIRACRFGPSKWNDWIQCIGWAAIIPFLQGLLDNSKTMDCISLSSQELSMGSPLCTPPYDTMQDGSNISVSDHFSRKSGRTPCSGDKLTLHVLLTKWLWGDLVGEFSISAQGHNTIYFKSIHWLCSSPWSTS